VLQDSSHLTGGHPLDVHLGQGHDEYPFAAQAVKIGSINQNPASPVNPPRKPVREMAVLDESQVSQMLVAAKGHRWEALYHLAIVTGMRESELLGLKWTDLDWTRKYLKVERQLQRPDGNGVVFVPTKTSYGKRSVALGAITTEVSELITSASRENE